MKACAARPFSPLGDDGVAGLVPVSRGHVVLLIHFVFSHSSTAFYVCISLHSHLGQISQRSAACAAGVTAAAARVVCPQDGGTQPAHQGQLIRGEKNEGGGKKKTMKGKV